MISVSEQPEWFITVPDDAYTESQNASRSSFSIVQLSMAPCAYIHCKAKSLCDKVNIPE